jgi:flagellar motor switch protein FliN
MTSLGPQIASEMAAQCRMAAGEIGQAFGRAFGANVEASVGEPSALSLADMASELASPGIAALLHIGAAAVAVLVSQADDIVPPSLTSAEVQAQSKLTTLAQELGMLVLPDALMADDIQAICVAGLASALVEGGAEDGASVIRLSLKLADKQGEAFVVWPLSSPRNISKSASPSKPITAATPIDKSSNTPENPGDVAAGDEAAANRGDDSTAKALASTNTVPPVTRAESPAGSPKGAPPAKAAPRGPTLRDLPPYTRSLLKIRVPLSVTLAAKKQPVGQILEIGPGSILQFEKSCEEMLDLNVNNLPIARGEAVKVGEKFGLRVTSLILPGERFRPVPPGSSAIKPKK